MLGPICGWIKAFRDDLCALDPDGSGVTLGDWPAVEIGGKHAADVIRRVEASRPEIYSRRFLGWVCWRWELAGAPNGMNPCQQAKLESQSKYYGALRSQVKIQQPIGPFRIPPIATTAQSMEKWP